MAFVKVCGSEVEKKGKHFPFRIKKVGTKIKSGITHCIQVCATTSVLKRLVKKKEQSGLFSGGFVSYIPSRLGYKIQNHH